MVSLFFTYLTIGFLISLFVLWQAAKSDPDWRASDLLAYSVGIVLIVALWPLVLYSLLEDTL